MWAAVAAKPSNRRTQDVKTGRLFGQHCGVAKILVEHERRQSNARGVRRHKLQQGYGRVVGGNVLRDRERRANGLSA